MKTGIKPQLTVWALTFSANGDYDWQTSFDIAVAADRAGVDRVGLTGEHVAFGEQLDAYGNPNLGGIKGGRQVTGPDGHYIEPIVTMSMMAARTERIRFVSNIMLAALRRPVVLAKMLSTLDHLSGGRVDLGVGVGWQNEEYGAAGLAFKDRGRLLDHTLEVCQTLWRNQRASYASPELAFENIHMMPKPANPDGIPIWVSGTLGAPAMRRLARFGAGWIPWGDASGSADGLIEAIPRMRDAVAKFGGDPAKIGVAGNLPLTKTGGEAYDIGATMDNVGALVEAGVTDFRAMLPVPRDVAAGEDFLAGWVQAFKNATA